MVVRYSEFWDLVDATQAREFEDKVAELIFKKEERQAFYKRLLDVRPLLSTDTFKEYFEAYSAERKSNQQDFTPDSVAKLVSILTTGDKQGDFNAYDPTAGTGTLLIAKWHHDRLVTGIGKYRPHNFLYCGEELSDIAIPYLIHNLALRGMNAVILHGDSLERRYKQIYFIQNSQDDHMRFSDVNLLPHSEQVAKWFDVREWTQEERIHTESEKVIWYGN